MAASLRRGDPRGCSRTGPTASPATPSAACSPSRSPAGSSEQGEEIELARPDRRRAQHRGAFRRAPLGPPARPPLPLRPRRAAPTARRAARGDSASSPGCCAAASPGFTATRRSPNPRRPGWRAPRAQHQRLATHFLQLAADYRPRPLPRLDDLLPPRPSAASTSSPTRCRSGDGSPPGRSRSSASPARTSAMVSGDSAPVVAAIIDRHLRASRSPRRRSAAEVAVAGGRGAALDRVAAVAPDADALADVDDVVEALALQDRGGEAAALAAAADRRDRRGRAAARRGGRRGRRRGCGASRGCARRRTRRRRGRRGRAAPSSPSTPLGQLVGVDQLDPLHRPLLRAPGGHPALEEAAHRAARPRPAARRPRRSSPSEAATTIDARRPPGTTRETLVAKPVS